MKLPVKYIAILVIVSLSCIFAYQAYWLVKMYHTNREQTDRLIGNAIRNADHIELFMRADSISKTESKGTINLSASFDNKDESSPDMATLTQKTWTDSTYRERKYSVGYSAEHTQIGTSYESLDLLVKQLQKGLHAAVDHQIAGINLSKFDSILSSDLRKSQLDISHYTQIVWLQNDSVMASSLPTSVDRTKLRMHEYIYNLHDESAYRIYTEPTGRLALQQMTGIIATSFIILLILAFSFWFLIRTILKQKTLDEMKSDFTNNITHELKTPIAVAYAANDALLNFNRAEDKTYRDKYLNIAQEQLQKLSGLVEQILSMSMERRKTFKLNVEEVDVIALVDALVEQHKMKADKPVSFRIDIKQKQLIIRTDRTHFSNIISNLIDNAIKYSPDAASLTIRCAMQGDRLQISIADKGTGIPADKQRYIFDKFYRVPSGNIHNVKGYGLGLFYVKTMVDKLGGSISVESEAGKGSTFTLTLINK